MTLASRRVHAHGVEIETTDHGTGPAVFFLHGVPDTRHGWSRVTDRLGDRVRILAPDFPGFGGSSPLPPGADLGPDAMGNLWGAFADAVLAQDERVIAVVHDFGGPWLLPWVLENRSRVRGLVVLNTLFHSDFRWHWVARLWQTPGLGELSMRTMPKPLFRSEMRRVSPGVDDAAIDEKYAGMHRTMRETTLRIYRAYADPVRVFSSWEGRLAVARDTIPTRVVWGDADPNLPASIAERFGANVQHLSADGHFVQLTRPDAVADAIRSLLD